MQQTMFGVPSLADLPIPPLKESDVDVALEGLAIAQVSLALRDAASSDHAVLNDLCEFMFGKDQHVLQAYCCILVQHLNEWTVDEWFGHGSAYLMGASDDERSSLLAHALQVRVASMITTKARELAMQGNAAAEAWVKGEPDGRYYIKQHTFAELDKIAREQVARFC